MEESRKGAAPGSSTKNSSASLDEDFGKDFLNSWKPSKFGKDSMDFDVEPIGGKSKKFSFGKMDDFDLGEDFGKLPSFKMDLDFSSPVKKTGAKPSNEKASMESFLGKKGKEKDEFSFNFDFDDHFGKFDLDPEISKEKKNTQAQPTASITSSDQNKSKTQNHFSKFDLDSEVSREKKNTQAQPTASITSSDQNITKSKTQNQNNSNMDIDTANNNNNNNNTLKNDTTSKIPSKSHTSAENISTSKQSKEPSDNLSNTSNSSSKINNRVITREESKEFSLPSVSVNNSSSSRRFREVFDKSDKQERETANSVQSMGSSSHSRSASPVVSSANREEIKEKDGQTQSQNNLGQTRSSDSDKSLSNVVLPPAIHRNSTPAREKLSASLLYKPQQTSILATKQACDIANKKIEGMNLLSSDMRRDSKKPDEQNEIAQIGLLTTLEKPSTKGASVGAGNSKIETENRTFSILRSNTNSSLLTSKGLMRDEKQTLVSRLVKLNPRSPTPNPTTISQDKDLRPAKFSSERNKASLSPQNKTPTAPPVPLFPSKEKDKEKPSFLSPSLKRKLSEESGPDPFISNPLKRISSNSPVETRKSPEIIPKSPKMIAGNGSPLEINNNLITPIVLPDFEMPVFLENNSNVEKAEKISKDLDDICSMLKKKQEEAKELLVRAVVNNNKLLMLNHPMYDEKLRALESFAATLCAKHLIIS